VQRPASSLPTVNKLETKVVDMADEQRNGVEPPRRRRAFPLRLVSSELPGRIELGIASVVLAAVFGVAFLIFNMPGPLVIEAHDDTGLPVMGARVTCTDALGKKEYSGITDVFGETKWPGLEKGMWSCRALPPDRFQGGEEDGSAQVRSRTPATVRVRFDRPLHLDVTVKRPHGSPRAKMAVRAICPATQTAAEAAWESRASAISGNAVLWLPFGRACRAGLVAPSLAADRAGLVEHAPLDCDKLPCSPVFSAPSGGSIDVTLEPTAAQWDLVRPPLDPEVETDGGAPAP